MRTLLVEDDPVQREAYERWLREYGLDVTAFERAHDGLLAHLRQPFDLMVVDWILPEMDGLQLCRRVRSMPGGDRPYVLVVTGRDRPADLIQVLDAGADDYVAKPVDFDLLQTRIRIAERRVASEARHRQAEKDLARSEADFRRVIERCPLGVLAHRDGTVVYANAAAMRTLGADKNALVGREFTDLFVDAYRIVARRRAARFERTDVPPPPAEMEVMRASGATSMLRFVPAARATYKGERACFVILEDITEQQRTQRELRMTQFAMDHAGDAALWIREDGRITYANDAACTMTGFGADELCAMSIVELDASVPSERWPSVRDDLLARGASHREGVLVHRDGRRIPIEMSTKPLDFDGERFLIAFARDLTERKRMQTNLQQADRLASVGSLAAGVAHEVNNPLAYVIANLELMAEELEDLQPAALAEALPALRSTVHEVIEGAHRVRRIVGDLKSFARPDEEDPHAVGLADVLDTAIDIAGNEIRHRATLERRYGPVSLILGNAGRLTQVFVNLLVNAAHAIPEDGQGHRITVTTQPSTDGWVEVEVADTGIGIGPDVVSHIFDPFFTTKPQGMGTGLGLSICHGIVAAMGGTISVQSELGMGSAFRLRLPAAAECVDAPKPAGPKLVRHIPHARRLRILVVDDEPLICEGIKKALPSHEVAIAVSGREALDRCRDADFDLVLCDVMMPDISGIEVFGQVGDLKPQMRERFVFMTGGAFTPRAREFLASLEGEQLPKPFSLDQLRSLVAKRADSLPGDTPGQT